LHLVIASLAGRPRSEGCKTNGRDTPKNSDAALDKFRGQCIKLAYLARAIVSVYIDMA